MTIYDPILTAAAFASLDAHPMIIHGAMKACQISNLDPDYFDFIAEAQLCYVETYCRQQKDAQEPIFQTKYQLNYLYTAVLWRLKNLRRIQRRQALYCQVTDVLPEPVVTKSENRQQRRENIGHYQLLLAQLLEQLTPEEQRFLWLRWVKRHSFDELIDLFHCSRRRLFYLQGRIQKLIDQLKPLD